MSCKKPISKYVRMCKLNQQIHIYKFLPNLTKVKKENLLKIRLDFKEICNEIRKKNPYFWYASVFTSK